MIAMADIERASQEYEKTLTHILTNIKGMEGGYWLVTTDGQAIAFGALAKLYDDMSALHKMASDVELAKDLAE